MRRVVAAVALLLPVVLAARPVSSQSLPQFSARADLVSIDVTVYDAQSRPLQGLRADDFVVLVDGAPRRVVASAFFAAGGLRPAAGPSATAEQSSIAPAGADRATARRVPDEDMGASGPPGESRAPGAGSLESLIHDSARTTRRTFVVVVDREQILTGQGQQVLAAAARFVTALPASDRVAVFTLPGKSGKLSFDQRRAVLADRIRRAAGTFQMSTRPDYLPQFQEERRQRAMDTIGGLRDLIVALAPVEGPKHIVLVTGGGLLDITTAGFARELGTLATSLRTQIHALHASLLPDMRAEVQGFRSECTDPRLLASGALALEFALLTGGFADAPTDGLIEGAAFDRLARQLSAWYVLGIEPAASDRDGRTHRVEVKLVNRPGAEIRARRTFHIDLETPMVETTAATAAPPPLPPPALDWGAAAHTRSAGGLLPYSWQPDWLDTAVRFCAKPELGPEVEEVAAWTIPRLQALTQWLQWVQDRNRVAQDKYGVPAASAAAMLHTAAFVASLGKEGVDPHFLHLNAATLLLDQAIDVGNRDAALLLQWYLTTGEWLLAYGRLSDAIRLTEDGLRRFRDDPRLVLLAGTLQERLASPLLNPLQYNQDERRAHEQKVKWSLEAAERRFERVLEAEPTNAEARLRLARVVERLGRPTDARAHYLATLAAAPPPEVAWLAHMWLGRQSEQAGDTEQAVEHYRVAAAIFPSQSTSVALAHALERSGQREAAREQLHTLTPPPGASAPACPDGCDPYQRYDLVDRERVAALVKALIRQACEAR